MSKVAFTHCSKCRCRISHGPYLRWIGHFEFCTRRGMPPDARASDARHPRMKPHR